MIVTHFQNAMASNDLGLVHRRVVDEILQTNVEDSKVATLLNTMKADATWPGINYEDLSRTGFQHSLHLENTLLLSKAYAQKKSKYYKDKETLKRIIASLEFWAKNDFICDNWWYNQVFTPRTLVDIVLIMDKWLKPDLKQDLLKIVNRANLDAPGARPGADRMKIGGIAARRGLATGDETTFATIMQTLNSEIKFNTGGRGLQHDLSFHHRADRVNNTYDYGKGWADVFAQWAAFVASTEFEFSDEKLKMLVDYYLDGVCKQMVYGKYIDVGVKNRSISRAWDGIKVEGISIPENLLKATTYREKELKEIIGKRQGNEKMNHSFVKYFWQSDLFVVQRPDYYTTIRMYSNRNRNMEQPYNSEGVFNHHKADGCNFLSLKGDEYKDIWPVLDWQKIPGTTILQKPTLPLHSQVQKEGLTSFVGAVENGTFGAVGFNFVSPHDHIKAKKAWFFFNDEYVCLGAGIESIAQYPVVSTVQQCLLNGDVKVKNNGIVSILQQANDHELKDVEWVLHNGVGYRFLSSTEIHLSNSTRSGSWYDINKQWLSSRDTIEKNVFKLWMDHGVQPQGRKGGFDHSPMIAKNVGYAYLVIPNSRESEMDENHGIRILSNNKKVQAVQSQALNISQMIFYEAEKVNLTNDLWINAESQAAVMAKTMGNQILELTVADPSRLLSVLHLNVKGKIDENPNLPYKSLYNEHGDFTHLSIKLPDGFYAGKSVVLNFAE